MPPPARLRHARVELALHELSDRDGPTLLLLHALGESSAGWGALSAAWPGRVMGLDFCGHGASGWVRGGVYLPEMLAGDADAALAELGHACLAGAGVGAYVALLLAGARPELVPAALLLPGRGLAGVGPEPDWDRALLSSLTTTRPLPGCDPSAGMLEHDPRPPDYALQFAAAAQRLLLLEDGTARPPWWQAVAATAATVQGDAAAGLRALWSAHAAPPAVSELRPRRD